VTILTVFICFQRKKRKEIEILKKLLKIDYFNAVNELGILNIFEMTLEKIFRGKKMVRLP
jgi:hypothetical protein